MGGPGTPVDSAAMEFGEFEIIVGAADKSGGKRIFPVFVSRSPCGAAAGTFEFDPGDPVNLALQTKAFDPADDGTGRLEFGSLLFRTLFIPVVRDVLANSLQWRKDKPCRGLRIRLWINDSELVAMPWELLADDSDSFLAASANMSVVRYLPTPEPPASEPTNCLKTLIVFSSPVGAEVKPEELQKLQTTLATFGGKLDIHILTTPTVKQLGDALQDDYHVVHYLGHGGSGCLYVADDDGNRRALRAADCAVLFSGRTLPLLLLNACHSANAEELTSGLFSGVAPAIIRQQVAAVIAMQYEFVTTNAAARFNESFYGAVLKGFPIDLAVNEARNRLAADLGITDRAWSTPVLYLSTRSVHIVPILSEGQDIAAFQAGMLTERIQGSPSAQAALQELARQVGQIEDQVGQYDRSRKLLLDIETLWNAFLLCRTTLDYAKYVTSEQRQEVARRWEEFRQGPFTAASATAAQMNDNGVEGAAALVDQIAGALGKENFEMLSTATDQLSAKLGTWRKDHNEFVENLLAELNKVIATAKAFLPKVN